MYFNTTSRWFDTGLVMSRGPVTLRGTGFFSKRREERRRHLAKEDEMGKTPLNRTSEVCRYKFIKHRRLKLQERSVPVRIPLFRACRLVHFSKLPFLRGVLKMILLLCHLGVEEPGVTLPNHSLKPLPHGRVEPGSAVPLNFMGCFQLTAYRCL